MQNRRLLIAASGTGGHIFPALAVARELADQFAIEWLGVPDRLETRLVPREYPLHTVTLQGLDRRPGLQWLTAATRLVTAVVRTRQLLASGGFAAAFTTGGYISAPLVLASRSLGLPVVGHESNALPGKVTRTLARSFTLLGLGFAEASERLPGARTRRVGTPVRSEFLRLPPEPLDLPIPEHAPLIVALGGSQGARGLNQLMVQAAPEWLSRGWHVVHLSGQGEYEAVKAAAPDHPAYYLFPFWERMGALLGRADLAVSRAGAGTLSELLVSGTPAVLVPFPFAAEDHQRINGDVLVRAGAALQFAQADLTAPVLARTVAELVIDEAGLRAMAAAARKLARPDAARLTADLVREAAGVAV